MQIDINFGNRIAGIILNTNSKLSNGTFDEWILIAVVLTISIIGIFISKKHIKIIEGFFTKKREESYDETIEKVIDISGYSYDPKQNIFYSNMDAWQRKMGYCRLYDEAAAPLGMIIDCEPIYFEYDNKRWMIEFWKGQYDLTTGCEVGVYNTTGPDLNIYGFFNGTFYYCASDEDMLEISYSLKKDGRILFKRKGKHWWLTGFILGMYSEPWELSMDIKIKLKDEIMLNSFVQGLRNANYKDNEIRIKKHTVRLKYNRPRAPQPYTRTEETDRIMQMKNRKLCDNYKYITDNYENMSDKMQALQKQSPEIYRNIKSLGKIRKLIEIYMKIQWFLDKK
ncbi:DUF4474 domain-containing protein [Clostridium sp. D2Q-11]|uniref:DUF4474 domain-containing protein n=2 Tax=Anaeromonas frigoriresistens TaxID=2683708 RepID=A0A942UXS1_9FIRM|nr:DUF4474 domain-containing protein [Anaeromonas frigoriresistens]